MPVWFVEMNESKFLKVFQRLWNWLNERYFYYLKNTKSLFRWKLLYLSIWFLYDCYLQWISCMKDFIMNSHTLSIFPAPEINKPSLVGKILWRLDIILHICLIHLFVSLDITAMINILELICKTLHDKMSEVINL